MAIVLPPPPPRSEPFTAVEFDLLDDLGNPVTLLICNGGMATVMRHGIPYYPRLTNLPILLGSTITVTQYGSPVRAQPNAGVIQFRIDASIWIWTAYHWIGRPFRVYEGSRPVQFATIVDVDADMVLVYAGRVGGFSHDCFTATVQTTDASLDLDNPLVTSFYDVTFPVSIQGKPRPTARGKFFSAQPVIVDETAQIYEVQSLPQGLWTIDEIRVGGVPWTRVVAPPAPGQWSPLNVAGTFQRFQLGSPPAGQDVRIDGTAGSYTIGQLITVVVTDAGGKVDAAAMAALDASTQLQQASLVTNTTPVNRLSGMDDFVTAGGCWWGFNPLEQATGAAISIPDPIGKYKLTAVEINTISLNTMQPLAWRLRVGSQRNWQPESSFDDGVLQTDIAKWSAPALVYEPHYENPNALTLEPRAVDVPLLASTSPNPADAANEQARLIAAWGENRTVFDVTVWMRPEDINLYDTVEVDFMMVTGLFRIVSAIRAIGGNGPATLQLWGTLGTVPPAPMPLPLPPPFIGQPPILPPGAGPPSFNPGPTLPIPISVSFVPGASVSLSVGSAIGSLVASIVVTMSDNSAFAGALAFGAITGPAASSAPLFSPTPGYWPNFTPTLANLLAQYAALSPVLQTEYNAVVGSDPGNFNNGPGLQNKVNLVALLTVYGGLAPAQQSQYDVTIVANSGTYNNTPSGLLNKLGLIQSFFIPPAGAPIVYSPDFTLSSANLLAQYAALPPILQAEFDSVVGSDPANFNNGPGLQNKVNLVALLTVYNDLSVGLRTLYDYTISLNAAYNNTPAGLLNKLGLIQGFYAPPPWAALGGNYLVIQGSTIRLSRNLVGANDDGVSTFVIMATQNGGVASGTLSVTVS